MDEVQVVRAGEGVAAPGAPWLFKASARDTAGRFDFMVGTVEYCTGPSLHVHDEQYDAFFVLSGVLTVQAGDDIVELGPGDFISVPPKVPHTFDNVHRGEPPARVVNLMVPGGAIDYFDQRAGLVDPDDEAAAEEAARAHGVTRVGPPLRARLGLP